MDGEPLPYMLICPLPGSRDGINYACCCLVTKSCPTLCNPHQAPLSMGFFRQEYWSGLPFPSPGDLPDSWIEPTSLVLAGRFFTTEPPGKSMYVYIKFKYTHNLPVYVFILKLMEYGIMPALKN